MDEATWLADSTDPQKMLLHLTGGPGVEGRFGTHPLPIATDRKLRLFAVACCRHQWDKLDASRDFYGPSRAAVEAAERYADGDLSSKQLREHSDNCVIWACKWCCAPDAVEAALRVSQRVGASISYLWAPPPVRGSLLRELFGNLWRPVVREHNFSMTYRQSGWQVIPADVWGSMMHWQDGKIPKMATAIYNDRSFADLPILADALEDAGCQNEEILRHCRGQEVCWKCEGTGSWKRIMGLPATCEVCNGRGSIPSRGPHVRGCWVIDLLLGRN